MSVHLFFEFLTAFVGTIAFALLFHVPKEYYVNCGLAGGCGWICYKLLLAGCGLFGSTFFATVLVVFLSRLSAVRRHCPVTIFLVAGIFPLVPGAGIYWTAYYVVTDQLAKASDRGFQTLKIAVAIVLGILFVFEFPQKWFRWAERGTAVGNCSAHSTFSTATSHDRHRIQIHPAVFYASYVSKLIHQINF